MREVEAQPVVGHERALLAHVVAEHALQRLVEEVRRRVVAAHGVAPRAVDLRVEPHADRERARLDLADVEREPFLRLRRAHAHADAPPPAPVPSRTPASPTCPPPSA